MHDGTLVYNVISIFHNNLISHVWFCAYLLHLTLGFGCCWNLGWGTFYL